MLWDEIFDAAWERAEEQGWADGLGGMEYVRVRNLWHRSGRPQPIYPWIVYQCNRPYWE